MAQNRVFLTGRVAIKDIEVKGDEGKEYCMFNLSVQRNYKPEGEQYYPEDLIICKAFKGQAKFLGEHFPMNRYVQIEGTLRKDDNYEKDGQMVYGQLYVLVENVYFPPRAQNSGEAAATTDKPASKVPTSKVPTGKSPLLGGKKNLPFK